MEGFIHDAYTLKALKQVRLGRSFFITGKAGTGKTTLLKEIVKECRARGKNIAFSAPTGVAAKNAELNNHNTAKKNGYFLGHSDNLITLSLSLSLSLSQALAYKRDNNT